MVFTGCRASGVRTQRKSTELKKVPVEVDLFRTSTEECGPAHGTIGSRAYWPLDTITFALLHFWRNAMKNLAISLALGASALFVTAASAAPLSADVSVGPGSNIQNVRMVCDENGRCWRQRDEGRVIIREPGDSYGYAPRERYIERRGYDEERGGGIGFRAPGVSIGIGTERY
jgi:hypothetical protein